MRTISTTTTNIHARTLSYTRTHTPLSLLCRPIVRNVYVGSDLLANNSYTKTVVDNRLEVSNKRSHSIASKMKESDH